MGLAVTGFDANGRIESVTSRTDNWETNVEWGAYERLPASDVGFDPTGTNLQSTTVQGAITELDSSIIPTWFGTRQQYNALPSIDPGVCYYIEEGT